ncbi:MAG: ABC transporter permease [Chitinophagales bacterium]|nr:ABC transporter permease [Chitinophagales bacterium]MDW8273172.1 ABC transporter permease [Chitinophagales bacterium]
MNLIENIRLAFRAIQSNMLRTVLTLLIIAFGIMALIGILTATEGIKASMIKNFKIMGSNTFSIRNEGFIRREGSRRDNPRRKKTENPLISASQASQFAKLYDYPAVVSLSWMAQSAATVKNEIYKTNPNVRVWGVDENYLKVAGLSLSKGRNFTRVEVENGQAVAIIGKDVAKKLFPATDVLDKFVSIGNQKVRIVGLQAEKGASQGSSDNQILIPYTTARKFFPSESENFIINILTASAEELDVAMEEAIGVMRNVRKLSIRDDNDFEMMKSDRLANKVIEQLKSVRYATIVIGVLTLLGAGIGLMNIMLVSVNERTREIGISKAIGASQHVIKVQFLTEAVVICQLGGIGGILAGVLLGNVVALLTRGGFVFPWVWVLSGIVFTFIVGLAAGFYPALKASKLDPVEALRYE